MKTFAKFILLFLLSVAAGAAFAQKTSSIAFSWTPSTSPACSGTSATSCQSTLTLTNITALTPQVISSAITPAATSYSFPISAPGTYNFSLVVDGFDALGNPTVSPAATATVVIPTPFTLNPPTGFKGTPQ